MPRRAAARAERLRELKNERRTLVFYESVHRVAETLAALAEHFGPDREAALARELTKIHEQIRSGTLGDLLTKLDVDIPLLGEFVILVAGDQTDSAPDERRAREIYDALVAEIDPNKALQLTATLTGVARNALYKLVRT